MNETASPAYHKAAFSYHVNALQELVLEPMAIDVKPAEAIHHLQGLTDSYLKAHQGTESEQKVSTQLRQLAQNLLRQLDS